MKENIKKELYELKDYCYKYLEREYGKNNTFIRSTKITNNGLFIYGHKVYAPGYSLIYKINTFISWYDSTDYNFINELLEHFVLDCKRLKEYK